MPAPLSVIRIYAESLRMWRVHFVRLTVLALFLEVPILLAELTLHIGSGLTIDLNRPVAVNSAAVPLALYGSLSHHFLSGLCEKIVGSARHGHHDPTLREIFHELPWWRLLSADLLMTVLVLIGCIAFVVPGILIATWLTPLLVLVNLERRTVRQSMRRSYEVVRGHFWRVFAVGFVAVLVVQTAVEVVAALAHRLGDSRALELLGHAVPATLLMPIAALPIVVLTFDLVALAPLGAATPAHSGEHEPAENPPQPATDAKKAPAEGTSA